MYLDFLKKTKENLISYYQYVGTYFLFVIPIVYISNIIFKIYITVLLLIRQDVLFCKLLLFISLGKI